MPSSLMPSQGTLPPSRPAEGSRPHLGPIGASTGHGLSAYIGLRGIRTRDSGGKPFNGVARMIDGGRTWTINHCESDQAAPNFKASWIENRGIEDGYSVWLNAPYDLAASPTDPLICYVTDLFRTYRTLDGGRTWTQVNSAPAGANSWTSRGLDVINHYGIFWDPFDAQRVFIPSTDIGLFRSEDGGRSWMGSSTGIPKAWRNTSYWVAFDPEVKELMWGAFSGTHDLPRPKMWRRTDPSAFRGGVGVSTDGGRHWAPSNSGMAESAITHVLLDPRSPKGNRTLYAAAFGRGVYKSLDNGRNWTLKNSGLAPDPRQQPFAWRLAQDQAGTLYLIVRVAVSVGDWEMPMAERSTNPPTGPSTGHRCRCLKEQTGRTPSPWIRANPSVSTCLLGRSRLRAATPGAVFLSVMTVVSSGSASLL